MTKTTFYISVQWRSGVWELIDEIEGTRRDAQVLANEYRIAYGNAALQVIYST